MAVLNAWDEAVIAKKRERIFMVDFFCLSIDIATSWSLSSENHLPDLTKPRPRLLYIKHDDAYISHTYTCNYI